nr:ABC transporter permease subunit [Rhizobium sp. ACO-34A]
MATDNVARAFGWALVATTLGAVEILVRTEMLNPYIIPPPSDVFRAVPRLVAEHGILLRVAQTAYEVVATGLLVCVVGIPIGVVMNAWRSVRDALEAWTAALAAAPLVLAFPLFLVIFGRSTSTIIAISFVTGLAPVILKTIEGLSGTKPVLLSYGASLSMTPRQILMKISIPSAIPHIMTGIRLGWTFVLISVVGVEFLINLGGIGGLVNELAESYDMPGTYAAILFAVAISVLFFVILEQAEKWLPSNR